MSAAAPQIDPEVEANAALRLGFCPQCDYSLEGLPPEGVCPECGRAYDQSYVVIRGVSLSNRAPVTPKSAAIVVAMMVVLSFTPGFLGSALGVFMAVYVGMLCLGAGLESWISPYPGQMLLWMSRVGIGQQLDADPGSASAWLRRAIPIVFAIGYPVTVLLPMAHGLGVWGYFGYGLFAVVPSGLWLLADNMIGQPKPVLSADGIRPPLISWRFFNHVEVVPIKRGKLRLIIRRRAFIPVKIGIEFYGPAILADQLRGQIEQWRANLPQIRSPEED